MFGNMFYSVIYFVCFSFLSLKVLASPFPNNGLKTFPGTALIDCSDSFFRKRIEVSKIPYRCLEKDASTKQLEAPKEEIIILENVDCSDPKRCRTDIEASLSEICQPEFAFDSALGECVPISRKECKEGYTYDTNVGRCISNSLYFPVLNDMTIKHSSSHKCPSGYVYSSEVDRCEVLVRPVAGGRPPVASLIKDRPEVSTLVYSEVVGRKKCSKDEVYVSEVDICVAYEKPPTQDKLLSQQPNKGLKVLRQRRYAQPVAAVQSTTEKIGRKKCKPGQIYISEIDHCVDGQKEENSAEKT